MLQTNWREMSESQPLASGIFGLFASLFVGPSLETSRHWKAFASLRKNAFTQRLQGPGGATASFQLVAWPQPPEAKQATQLLHYISTIWHTMMNKKDFNPGATIELCDLSSTVAAAANGLSQPLYRFGVTINKINMQRFIRVKSDKWPVVVAAGEKWLSRARRSSCTLNGNISDQGHFNCFLWRVNSIVKMYPFDITHQMPFIPLL